MSSSSQRNENQPERQRNQQSLIHYISRDNEIKNQGYIDSSKLSSCMRLLSMNARGLDPSNNVKMEHFIESVDKYQIDMMLINEVNMKWTPSNLDKMENKMKRL